MSDENIWASTAPQYKKDGKMYANVTFDDEGNPDEIHVAQDQIRKGEFNVNGRRAELIPFSVVTLPEPGEEVREYVEQFDFIDYVKM